LSAVRRASGLLRACAGLALALGLVACQTPPPVPLPHQVLVRAHLADLVEKQGFACASVVEHVRLRRLDYQVLCDTGRAYQVWVGAEGRVNVQPLDDAARDGAMPRPAPPQAAAPG
jgi:hypothetical protein